MSLRRLRLCYRGITTAIDCCSGYEAEEIGRGCSSTCRYAIVLLKEGDADRVGQTYVVDIYTFQRLVTLLLFRTSTAQ